MDKHSSSSNKARIGQNYPHHQTQDIHLSPRTTGSGSSGRRQNPQVVDEEYYRALAMAKNSSKSARSIGQNHHYQTQQTARTTSSNSSSRRQTNPQWIDEEIYMAIAKKNSSKISGSSRPKPPHQTQQHPLLPRTTGSSSRRQDPQVAPGRRNKHHDVESILESGKGNRPTEMSSPVPRTSLLDLSALDDFTMKNPPNTDDDDDDTMTRHNHCSNAKVGAWIVGLGLCIGLAAGIVALVGFLKTNSIQLRPATKNGGSSAATTVVTWAELATHNTPQDDCWVVYYGQVYRMDKYASRHPGGASWINPWCGQDATTAFSQYHPESLLRTVQSRRYLMGSVGDVAGGTSTSDTGSNTGTVGADGRSSSDTTATGTGSNAGTTGAAPTGSVGAGGSSGATDTTGAGAGTGSDTGNTGATTTGISWTELALHDTPQQDCWVAYFGQVFRMDSYASRHPGGASWINPWCGQDGTSQFSRHHPQSLLESIREQYWIGDLAA